MRLPWSVVSRSWRVWHPHSIPSTLYTQKLFKSNVNIVVNISCKFHNCLNILTSLSKYSIANRQVRVPWSVLVGRESVVTGSAPPTPPPAPHIPKNMIENAFNSRKNVGAVVSQSWRAVLICSRQPGGEARALHSHFAHTHAFSLYRLSLVQLMSCRLFAPTHHLNPWILPLCCVKETLKLALKPNVWQSLVWLWLCRLIFYIIQLRLLQMVSAIGIIQACLGIYYVCMSLEEFLWLESLFSHVQNIIWKSPSKSIFVVNGYHPSEVSLLLYNYLYYNLNQAGNRFYLSQKVKCSAYYAKDNA